MILCFQCEDLSKIFLVSKFEINRPNIKLIITFCAIWHYRDLKGQLKNIGMVSEKLYRNTITPGIVFHIFSFFLFSIIIFFYFLSNLTGESFFIDFVVVVILFALKHANFFV